MLNAALDASLRRWSELSLELLNRSQASFELDYLLDEKVELRAAKKLLQGYQRAEYDEVQAETTFDNLTLKLLGLVSQAAQGADVADASLGSTPVPLDPGLLQSLGSSLDAFEAETQRQASRPADPVRQQLLQSLRQGAPPPPHLLAQRLRQALEVRDPARSEAFGWNRFAQALDRLEGAYQDLTGPGEKIPQLQAEQRFKARQAAAAYTQMLTALGASRFEDLLTEPPQLSGTPPTWGAPEESRPSRSRNELDRMVLKGLQALFPHSTGPTS